MWSEAIDMLARADRLHRELFEPLAARPRAAWQPPVDVLETDGEVVVLTALPGVAPDQVDAVIENGVLVITGQSTLPDVLRRALIHRMELPRGRFERRVALPPGRYSPATRTWSNGCLVVSLRKLPNAGAAQ
jgi:HSP20 family molecular chaperone IbpA